MHEATVNAEKLHIAQAPKKSGRSPTLNGLLCALAMATAVLISNPSADMPFLDDFSYVKSALDFANTGHIVYNGWAVEILGWLVPWGAIFIKLFGFSFRVVQFSMLPLAMAIVFLFHQVLRRFDIAPANAILGTLTLALSPLFLPLAASFMTDIPGLLVIVVCIYMCQRAVAANTDRSTLMWLCVATAVNVAGGTVRQIAWLGSLIMVPSTAWLLRQRQAMKAATALLFVLAFAGVEACMQWFAHQPYSVPEHIIAGPIHAKTIVHLGAQLFKTFLCLVLVLLPLSIAWLSAGRRLGRDARLRIAGAVAVTVLIAILLYRHGTLQGWLMPWLTYLIAGQSSLMGPRPDFVGLTGTKLTISLLVVVAALIFFELWIAGTREKRQGSEEWQSRWAEIRWILGPFSFSYLLLLGPRGAFSIIQSRYLLGLVPGAIAVLLLLYQERIAPQLPGVAIATLAAFAIFSIAGTHDLFSESRAVAQTIRTLEDSGISRYLIQAGFPDDGWAQIQHGGHINDPRIEIPAGAYHYTGFNLTYPRPYTNWFGDMTPAIVASYFIVPEQLYGLAPTNFPPVHYTTWLPPFDRTLYVQQLKTGAK